MEKKIKHKYTHTLSHPPLSLSTSSCPLCKPIRWNYKITTNWHDCLSPSLTPSHGVGLAADRHSRPSYMYDVIVIDFSIWLKCVCMSVSTRRPCGALLYWKSPFENHQTLASKAKQSKRYNLCLPKEKNNKKEKKNEPQKRSYEES